jgi:hypothetical protein
VSVDGNFEANEDGAAEEDGGGDEATERRPHGDPCTSGEQCLGGFCIDETLDESFVDGYCSAVYCDPHFAGACGEGGECFDTEVYPPLCARSCETDGDCRVPDYVCVGVCIPDDFTAELERPGTLTGTEEEIRDFVAAVDDERMMRRVRILAGEEAWDGPAGPVTIRSRAVEHPDHALAIDYLEAELSALGLAVRRLPFEQEGLALTNLEAEVPGADPDAGPVLVTAHFDATAAETAGWEAAADPAPGAVDNGAGVVVALEVASILTAAGAAPPPRPVRIVLFDAEERGLWGSEDYVADLVAGGGTIDCAANADMIGWSVPATRGRFWYVFGEESTARAALGAEAIDLFVPGARPITSDYVEAGASDNGSFYPAGYCAVGFASWPRRRSNHTVDDGSAEFDAAFFRDASRAVAAVAAAWIHAE